MSSSNINSVSVPDPDRFHHTDNSPTTIDIREPRSTRLLSHHFITSRITEIQRPRCFDDSTFDFCQLARLFLFYRRSSSIITSAERPEYIVQSKTRYYTDTRCR